MNGTSPLARMSLVTDPFQEGTMCHSHSTLRYTDVRTQTRDRLVRGLHLRAYGLQLTPAGLADLLLVMAGRGLSLFGLFAFLRGLRYCYETARLALRTNLPAHDTLLQRLRQTLLDVVPGRLRRRRHD